MGLSEAFLTWEQEKETQSKQEERQAIALNFLRQGLAAELVAQGTGLTIEQVQALQTQDESN